MRDKFNEYFNADEPMCPHTAFESGYDAAPSGFWQGFIMGAVTTAPWICLLWWLA